jgi:hypothetical protein
MIWLAEKLPVVKWFGLGIEPKLQSVNALRSLVLRYVDDMLIIIIFWH